MLHIFIKWNVTQVQIIYCFDSTSTCTIKYISTLNLTYHLITSSFWATPFLLNFYNLNMLPEMLISKIELGEVGQFTYGQTSPLLSFNIHSLLEHTAFSIAADCLYGVNDVMIETWSRKIRWALQQTSESTRATAIPILQGWTDALMSLPVPTGMDGPLLQGLHEVRDHKVLLLLFCCCFFILNSW